MVQQQSDVPSTDSISISGGGTNTIAVETLSANNALTLDPASGGSDNVLLGSFNQVAGIQGEVFVSSQQSTSQITINDSADPTAHHLDLVQDLSSFDPNSNMAFQVDGRSLISFVDDQVSAFTLNSGTGANNIHTGPVGDFPRGFTITLNTNGAGTQTLLDVLPSFTDEDINDTAGSSTLTLQSGGVRGGVEFIGSSDNSDAIKVLSDEVFSDTAFQIDGGDIGGLNAGGFVSFTHIGSVSVTGGSEFDNFSVAPSGITSFTIDGGASNSKSMDRLQVNTSGTQPELDLSADSSGDHGTFTFRNAQPITFSRVGEVTPTFGVVTGTVFNAQNLNPAVGVTVVADANNNGVVDPGEKTAITASDGTFLFAGLDTGTYGLLIQNTGISLLTPTSVNVTSGGAAATANLAILPGVTASGPDLTATVTPAASRTATSTPKVSLKITNIGAAMTSATPLQVLLFASADKTLDTSDSKLLTITTVPLSLKTKGSKVIILTGAVANTLTSGQYFILASVDANNLVTESNESNNVVASAKAVLLAPPLVDLTGKFSKVAKTASNAKPLPVTFSLENLGTVAASGTIDIDFFVSTDMTLDTSDVQLGGDFPVAAHVANGKTQNVKFNLPLSSVPAGSYFLVAKVNSTNSLTESNTGNNIIFSTTPIAIA